MKNFVSATIHLYFEIPSNSPATKSRVSHSAARLSLFPISELANVPRARAGRVNRFAVD